MILVSTLTSSDFVIVGLRSLLFFSLEIMAAKNINHRNHAAQHGD